jgi:hypothetical protein
VIPAPDLIKIDVEGAEYLVLEGARLLLNQQKPMLFIALHGAEQKRRCQKALERLDYQISIWMDLRSIPLYYRTTRYMQCLSATVNLVRDAGRHMRRTPDRKL